MFNFVLMSVYSLTIFIHEKKQTYEKKISAFSRSN